MIAVISQFTSRHKVGQPTHIKLFNSACNCRPKDETLKHRMTYLLFHIASVEQTLNNQLYEKKLFRLANGSCLSTEFNNIVHLNFIIQELVDL